MRRYALFLIILACGVLFGAISATEIPDRKLLDAQFRLLRAWFPRPAAREVVVVGIDEETTKNFPEPITLWHRHLGQFLSAMAQAKPAVVGIDLVLPDRSFESVLAGSDRALMQGMLEARRAYPLVIALTVDETGKPRRIHPPFLGLAGPDGAGYALFPVDADGVVRRFDERLSTKAEPIPTLVGQMARRLELQPRAGWIDYSRGERFRYVPLQRVMQWHEAGDRASLERAFGGKPVLLGTMLPFTDRLSTPVALDASEPNSRETFGVLVQAQALRNLVDRGLLARVPAPAIAGLAALAALLWFVSASAPKLIAAFVVFILASLAASLAAIMHGWFLPVAAPLATGTLALVARNGGELLAKLRERARLRASFSGYVSPAVMDAILSGGIRPELGGAKKFVCVLFSDIRGYTTRSERMTPEQVIAFLNRYFEQMVARIHERGGSVTSFMGDGIMAVFGAPKPLDNPCLEAFEAARAMLRYVAELNQSRPEGEAPLDIGIGLHAGEAVIGHVGSSQRHDYTAIGDVTNVASRLESLTKEAGYRVILSRTVFAALGSPQELVALGPMSIKGHTPVEVHGYDKI
jgi:class 3 adenylate cyclase